MMRFRFAWPLVMGLLLLTACEDPSNVGIGLVDEQGDPQVQSFATSAFDTMTVDDFTGNSARVLVGNVEDPLTGTITATGYVDFVSTAFDNTNNPTITGVSLLLSRDYIYGDTATTASISVFDLVEDWSEIGGRADTTLPKGMLVTTVDFQPTDTLITIPLPEAWITSNDATLRSTTFESSFHGFALEAAGGNAIVGVNESGSFLRIFTSADTLNYTLTRTLSGLSRTSDPVVPSNRVLIQDGVGPTVSFNFDFSGLEDTPLNGALVRLFADSLTVNDTPPNFVRPLMRELQLIGTFDTGLVLTLGSATLTEEGFYRFREAFSSSTPTLSAMLQQQFFGNITLEHLTLRANTTNSLNTVLLYDATSTEQAPVALLTVSSPGR